MALHVRVQVCGKREKRERLSKTVESFFKDMTFDTFGSFIPRKKITSSRLMENGDTFDVYKQENSCVEFFK